MENSINLKYHYKLSYRRNSNILAIDYKTIYFNTQKNANSSIKAQFVDILGIPRTDNFPKDIHYKYEFPSANQCEINSKYGDFLKFSILRNPWDRLYSCYKNKIEKSSETGADYILECSPDLFIGMPFEEFVEVICEIPDSESDYHFCSQIYLMLYPDGMLPINYLCNIENLDFHLEEIKSKTNIPFTTSPRLNSSKTSSYELAYTPKLIEKVGTRYQADIQLFNYEFGKNNNVFPFGFINSDLEKRLTESPLMIQILKEKNRELSQELKIGSVTIQKKINQSIKKINQLNKKINWLNNSLNNSKEAYNAITNSISWKITSPLRSFISHFQKK